MNFKEFFDNNRPTTNVYVYDNIMKDRDHIMLILASSFLNETGIFSDRPTWTRASGERCITPRTHHLLVFLHKLGVRPHGD